jgi:hypothetical protein
MVIQKRELEKADTQLACHGVLLYSYSRRSKKKRLFHVALCVIGHLCYMYGCIRFLDVNWPNLERNKNT